MSAVGPPADELREAVVRTRYPSLGGSPAMTHITPGIQSISAAGYIGGIPRSRMAATSIFVSPPTPQPDQDIGFSDPAQTLNVPTLVAVNRIVSPEGSIGPPQSPIFGLANQFVHHIPKVSTFSGTPLLGTPMAFTPGASPILNVGLPEAGHSPMMVLNSARSPPPGNSPAASPLVGTKRRIHRYLKQRRRLMPAEAKILVDFFETGKRKPDYEERKRLGDQLNMTPREVQVWFQNRRAKAKKVERSTANAGGAGGNASSPAGPAYETTRPGYTAPGPAPASEHYPGRSSKPVPYMRASPSEPAQSPPRQYIHVKRQPAATRSSALRFLLPCTPPGSPVISSVAPQTAHIVKMPPQMQSQMPPQMQSQMPPQMPPVPQLAVHAEMQMQQFQLALAQQHQRAAAQGDVAPAGVPAIDWGFPGIPVDAGGRPAPLPHEILADLSAIPLSEVDALLAGGLPGYDENLRHTPSSLGTHGQSPGKYPESEMDVDLSVQPENSNDPNDAEMPLDLDTLLSDMNLLLASDPQRRDESISVDSFADDLAFGAEFPEPPPAPAPPQLPFARAEEGPPLELMQDHLNEPFGGGNANRTAANFLDRKSANARLNSPADAPRATAVRGLGPQAPEPEPKPEPEPAADPGRQQRQRAPRTRDGREDPFVSLTDSDFANSAKGDDEFLRRPTSNSADEGNEYDYEDVRRSSVGSFSGIGDADFYGMFMNSNRPEA